VSRLADCAQQARGAVRRRGDGGAQSAGPSYVLVMGKRSAKERQARAGGALAPVKLAKERSDDDEATLPAWVLCLCTPLCRCKSCFQLPIELQCLILPALLSPFAVYSILKDALLITDARVLYGGALAVGALSYSPLIMYVFVDFLSGVYSNPAWSWSSRAPGTPAPWTEEGYRQLRERSQKEREAAVGPVPEQRRQGS
jgi:hypothetical protein